MVNKVSSPVQHPAYDGMQEQGGCLFVHFKTGRVEVPPRATLAAYWRLRRTLEGVEPDIALLREHGGSISLRAPMSRAVNPPVTAAMIEEFKCAVSAAYPTHLVIGEYAHSEHGIDGYTIRITESK